MLAYTEIDESTKVATVFINRPEVLNTINLAMAQALNQAVMPLADRSDLRCIVLRGNGNAFMAGGDLAFFADNFDAATDMIDALLDVLDPVIKFLFGCPVPVLACVHGAVAGAGMSLMSACDLVIAAQGTRFLIAYDKVGAPPDCGGSYFLPRLLGERRAASLMFLGETWSAQQALEYGLVNRVFPADSFAAECANIIAQVASGPTQAFGHYKKLLHEKESSVLSEQLDRERKAFREATLTADFRSGVTAFLNKTKANYQGR